MASIRGALDELITAREQAFEPARQEFRRLQEKYKPVIDCAEEITTAAREMMSQGSAKIFDGVEVELAFWRKAGGGAIDEQGLIEYRLVLIPSDGTLVITRKANNSSGVDCSYDNSNYADTPSVNANVRELSEVGVSEEEAIELFQYITIEGDRSLVMDMENRSFPDNQPINMDAIIEGMFKQADIIRTNTKKLDLK